MRRSRSGTPTPRVAPHRGARASRSRFDGSPGRARPDSRSTLSRPSPARRRDRRRGRRTAPARPIGEPCSAAPASTVASPRVTAATARRPRGGEVPTAGPSRRRRRARRPAVRWPRLLACQAPRPSDAESTPATRTGAVRTGWTSASAASDRRAAGPDASVAAGARPAAARAGDAGRSESAARAAAAAAGRPPVSTAPPPRPGAAPSGDSGRSRGAGHAVSGQGRPSHYRGTTRAGTVIRIGRLSRPVHWSAGATGGARCGAGCARGPREPWRCCSLRPRLAACEADLGSDPDAETSPTAAPVDRPLTFGVLRHPRTSWPPTTSLVAVYNSLYDDAEMTVETYLSREALMGTIRESGEVPDVFLTSGATSRGSQEQQLVQPVDSAPDRARRRLRRPLLARRGARVQRRGPAAVHAVRHLADGDLLQHRAGRLRRGWRRASCPCPDGGAATAGTSSSSPPRPSSRPGRAAAPAASTSTRPCDGLAPFIYSGGGEVFDDRSRRRRSPSPTTARRRPWSTALSVLRDPRLTLSDEQLRAALGAGVVQARQARDDRGLPRPGPAAAPGAGPGVRRDPDARRSSGPPPSATSPACACRPTPTTPRPPPTSWSTWRRRSRCAGWPGGLPRAGQPRGRAVRGLPPAGPGARPRAGLQQHRPHDRAAAAARRLGRARAAPSRTASTSCSPRRSSPTSRS